MRENNHGEPLEPGKGSREKLQRSWVDEDRGSLNPIRAAGDMVRGTARGKLHCHVKGGGKGGGARETGSGPPWETGEPWQNNRNALP